MHHKLQLLVGGAYHGIAWLRSCEYMSSCPALTHSQLVQVDHMPNQPGRLIQLASVIYLLWMLSITAVAAQGEGDLRIANLGNCELENG